MRALQYVTKMGCASALLLNAISVSADDHNGVKNKWTHGLTIGAGATYESSVYRGWNEDETTPIPAVQYRSGNFSFTGTGAGYTVWKDQIDESHSALTLLTEVNIDPGYEASDSPFLVGMADRDDTTVDLGFRFDWSNDLGELGVTFLQDVSDTHKGFVFDAQYSVPLTAEHDAFQIAPNIGITYNSEDYNDYYYGVRRDEATSFRSAYSADADFNPYIGLDMSYWFSRKIGLIANVTYTSLGSEIKDSPIVGKKDTTSALLSLVYRF